MTSDQLKKPCVSEDLAIELALRHYGLKVTSVKRMVGFNDQNFHIKVSNDCQNPYIRNTEEGGYTLKVTNTKRSSQSGYFDTMHEAMIHLHNKGLKVPIPIPNIEGKTWKLDKVPLLNEDSQDSDKPYLCGIHLLTFIPGQPVSTVTSTKSLLYQWGHLLAQFHNATEDLSSPLLKRKKIFWDLEHVPEIKEYIIPDWDPHRKDLVLSVLNQYPQQIEKNLHRLRKGFIHGDFNENNILLEISEQSPGEEPQCKVEGILDLEDMHYGTYVWDVGVMLAYTLLDCQTMDPLEGAGHALAGYLKLRQLNDLELSLLKMCISCRLSQSLVLGAYSFSLDPLNTYLTITARTGWQRLAQIWNAENDDLLRNWKEIRLQYATEQS